MSNLIAFDPALVKGYECKHVMFNQAQDGSYDDLLTVKEIVHFKDGTSKPQLRFLRNYKRPIYITREGHRNHKDKKECESLDKLQMFPTTQTDMLRTIARGLNRGPIQGGLRIAARSPYLYGVDVTSAVIVKRKYRTEYPDCISDNSVAVLDIETDVVEKHERPIIVSLTFKDKAVMAVDRRFLGTIPEPEKQIRKALDEYLGDVIKARNLSIEILVVDTISEGIVQVIKRAHQWRPDFVAIWNINFDIPRIVALLESEGINPADVFSDPEVPAEFRYFQYREGPAKKKTAAGAEKTLAPDERWHTVTCPASFYLIDSMCVYSKIRTAQGRESSYSLDAILKKHKCKGKLKFSQADSYVGLGWHIFMQTNFKIEYCVYNLFDCIAVELLDDKINDLKRTISVLCGASEYARFNSQPRRLCDDLHFYLLEKQQRIIASTSDQLVTELDEMVIGLLGWIE